MQDNPFDAPQVDVTTARSRQTRVRVHVQDDGRLIAPPRATLPLVCARCGVRDEVEHVRVHGRRTPLWVWTLVFAGPLLPFLIRPFVGARWSVFVGLCPTHRRRRLLALAGTWGAMVTGAAALVLGCGAFDVLGQGAIVVMVLGALLTVLGGISQPFLVRPFRVVSATRHRAVYVGAHPGLLEAVVRARRVEP